MSDQNPHPLERFRELWTEARAKEPVDANAVALATVDEAGSPSLRFVLLKEVSDRGFVFFTNYESRKGSEIDARGACAMTALWADMETQVRVEGRAERISAARSDAYFASRSRGSQLGAWASKQSRPLEAMSELQERVAEFERRFPDEVPRPPHWGGFELVPKRIEFWFGKPHRLHERIIYTREGADFVTTRLFP